MSNVFYYEDGQDNVYDEQGMRVYDPMKDVLTEVIDSNIILETLTNQKTYFDQKPLEKLVVDNLTSAIKKENNSLTKMIECAQEKGAAARVARSMGINVRNAQRWWKQYREDGTMPYKKSSEMKGRPSTFTDEHDSYLIELIDDDSQIIVSDIMERLTEKFEGFSISNSRLNHNLKNDLCLTMKKVTFEAEARNSKENLQQRFD
ncbi:hypothetical protein G6F56_008615 [Rhizopus delemar]|nr:hypothetical protein G6F56_008615 [Rhizopus delemar]